MDKAKIAEWFLARVSTKARASAMVGDLMEEGDQRPASFWFRVFSILFALSWRVLFASVAAYFSFVIPFLAFLHFSVRHDPLHAGQGPFEGWIGRAVQLLGISICLLTVVALSAILHGFRDATARVALALTLITLCGSCFAWLPFAGYIAYGVLAIAIVAMLVHRDLRRPLFCVVSATGGFMLAFLLFGSSATYVGHRIHGSLLIMILPMWCMTIAVQAWVLQRARRLLLPA